MSCANSCMPDVLGIPQRQCITSLRHVHRVMLAKIGEFVSTSKDMQDITALWQQLAQDSGTRTLPECIQLLMKTLKDTSWPDCNPCPGLNLEEQIRMVPLAADIILSTVMQFHGERGTRLNKKLISILADMDKVAKTVDMKHALRITLNGAKPRKDTGIKHESVADVQKSFLSRVQRIPPSQQLRNSTAIRPDSPIQGIYGSAPSAFQRGWGRPILGASVNARNLIAGRYTPSSVQAFPVPFRQEYPGTSGNSTGLADQIAHRNAGGHTPQGHPQSYQYPYVHSYSGLQSEIQVCNNSVPGGVQLANTATNPMTAEQFQTIVQRLQQQQGARPVSSIDYLRAIQPTIASVFEGQPQEARIPFTSVPSSFSFVTPGPYHQMGAEAAGPPGALLGSSVPRSSNESCKLPFSDTAHAGLCGFKPVSGSIDVSGQALSGEASQREAPCPSILIPTTCSVATVPRTITFGPRAETSYRWSGWQANDLQADMIQQHNSTVLAASRPPAVGPEGYCLDFGSQHSGRTGIVLEPTVQSQATYMKMKPGLIPSSHSAPTEQLYKVPSRTFVSKDAQLISRPVSLNSNIRQPAAYVEVGQGSSDINVGVLHQEGIQQVRAHGLSQPLPNTQRNQQVSVDAIHSSQHAKVDVQEYKSISTSKQSGSRLEVLPGTHDIGSVNTNIDRK